MQSQRANTCYLFYTTLFSAVLILSNIMAVKLFRAPFFGNLALPCGVITYPLTFLLTDIVSEVWGKAEANRMVYLGFAMNLVMLVVVQLSIALPAHAYLVHPGNPQGYTDVNHYQSAFESVFSINGKLFLAAMVAYMASQLVDIKLFHYFRDLTRTKHLWLRNNIATMVSQVLDTLIFGCIVFYWGLGMPLMTGVEIMGTMILFKWILALLDTPFCYMGVALTKRLVGNKDVQHEVVAPARLAGADRARDTVA